MAKPDCVKRAVAPQKINMPMRAISEPVVMRQSRRHPARTEGAARIDHPARRQRQPVTPANGDDIGCGNP